MDQGFYIAIFLVVVVAITFLLKGFHRWFKKMEGVQEKYQLVVENTSELICLLDVSGNITYLSPSFKKTLGYSDEELKGTGLFSLINHDDEPRVISELMKGFFGQRVNLESFRVRHKDGHPLILDGSVNAVSNAQNTPYVLVLTLRNSTDRKKYEERLELLNERVTNILESITDAFFALDHMGKIIFLNKQAEKLLQTSGERVLGKSVYDEFPEIIDSTFYQKYFRVIATRKSVIFEKDYHRKCFEIHAYPSRDGLSVYLTDITQRKKAEELVRENEERFILLAESVPQIIWTTRPNGSVDYFNKRWYDFTGMSPIEAKHGGWRSAIHPDDQASTMGTWKRSLKLGMSFETQCRLRKAHGDTYKWFLVRAVPIRNAEKEIIKWFGTSTDIDDQKKLDERKDEFISTASHELKTPITTIKAFTQLLQRRFDPQKYPEESLYLYKMDYQANRLKTLINDLLDVSKIQAGKLEFMDKEFNFDEFLHETIEDMQTNFPRHKLILKGEIHDTVYADRYRIGQALTNLISNAVKYSLKADKVIIHVERKGDYVQVGVQDFGIGIPQDEVQKIFGRFYRVHGGSDNRFEGMGLGLHISSEIIKHHQGNMWVKSEEGAGSTFYFSIPIMHNHEKAYLSN